VFLPTRAALGAVLGLVLLAGCSAATTAPGTSAPVASTATTSASAPSGSSDQSVADACSALTATMKDAASTMQSATSDFSSDPEKAIKALQTFRDTFATATAQVNNPTVTAQAQKALDATKKMVSALETVIKDPTKVSEVQGVMSDFQTEMTKLGTVCP
jgi:hypothetical protein